MKSMLFEEIKEHRINSLFDLQETDQWVNDATRKEINWILDNYNDGRIFGVNDLYSIVEKENLRDARNFSVKLLFKEEKRNQVKTIIDDYTTERTNKEFIDFLPKFFKSLIDLSCYCCVWV